MLISYLSNHLMMLLIPFVIRGNDIGEKMLFSWVRRLHSELLYLSLGCLSSPAAPTPTCFLFGRLLFLVSLLSQQVKFSLMQHVETCSLTAAMCSVNGEKVWSYREEFLL